MDVEDYGPLLTANAFLEIDFGERIKAELDDGEIKIVERGPADRVWVVGNLQSIIHRHFRGTGKRTYGGQLMLKTGPRSVRFPDVAVYSTDRSVARYGDRDLMADPLLVVRVARRDRAIDRLVDEYERVASVEALLLVDHETEIVRSFERTPAGRWCESIVRAGGSVHLAALNLTITHADVFAHD